MSSEDLKSSSQQANKVPGSTIGFSAMITIIVFVAIWMGIQGGDDSLQDSSDALNFENADDSLLAELGLPNDPLWGFVEIQAGDFTMGSNPVLDRLAYENERWSDRQRQGKVYLPAFYIGRYETTIAQFAIFAEEVGLDLEQIGLDGSSNLAVHNVTWSDAVSYASWLETKLRSSSATPDRIKTMLQEGGQVTLPSEAEWEKAARGTDGRIFPWGSQPTSDFANFNTKTFETTFINNVEIIKGEEIINGDELYLVLDREQIEIQKNPSLYENLIRITRNVVYKKPGYTLEADILEIDLITKNIKIYMLDDLKKVNAKSKIK